MSSEPQPCPEDGWAIASALCYAGLAVALSQAIGWLGPNGRRPPDESGCPDGDCPGKAG